MWINRELQAQKSVFKDKEDAFAQSCLSNVYTWATCNPKSIINLWFDSTLTPEHAVKHTQSIITEHMKKYPKSAPIVLKDIRELAHVEKHPNVFSDKTPVYFRADLLRVVAGLEILARSKNNSCFVYADFDVTPMNQKNLFDESTKKNLQEYGIVMADGGHLGFENSFYMLTSNNPYMIKSLELAIVELNIQRAQYPLNIGQGYVRYMRPLQQIIYDSYPLMFKYCYHMSGLGTLKTASGEPYDYERDGLNPFGVKNLSRRYDLTFETTDEKLKRLKSLSNNQFWHTWVPTKKIESTPASLNYD